MTASTPTSCNGGSDGTVTLTVSGGSAPYNTTWNPALIPNDATTGSNLPAGTYNVTISDAVGCTFVASSTVTEPAIITIAGNSSDENCGEGDGTISTNVQGGTSPYQYAWTPATASGANPTGLAAGDYSLVVTDDNGCTASFSITVNTPAALVLTVTGVDAACNGENSGSISTTATGGVAPYNYQWHNGLATV